MDGNTSSVTKSEDGRENTIVMLWQKLGQYFIHWICEWGY